MARRIHSFSGNRLVHTHSFGCSYHYDPDTGYHGLECIWECVSRLKAGKAPLWRGFAILKVFEKFMPSKILLRRILLLVILAGSAFFLAVLFRPILKNFNLNGLPPDAAYEQKRIQPGLPARLKIPKINVDAAIEEVGLTSDGAMDAPKKQSDTAWFKLGPRPGENGSAVISGHYGRWANGSGSVFDDLNKLSKGDKIYIETDQGETITFVVRANRSYDLNADASDVFGSNNDQAHLNLITCEGVWNKVSKSYPLRLVVFTDREAQ